MPSSIPNRGESGTIQPFTGPQGLLRRAKPLADFQTDTHPYNYAPVLFAGIATGRLMREADLVTTMMCLRVHRGWEAIVHPQDRDCIRAVFADLEVRSGLDPEGTFQHVSSLNLDPIVTAKTGARLDADLGSALHFAPLSR